MRRRFPLALATLVAGLALLVGCKKKPPVDDVPNPNPPGTPGAPNPPTPGGAVAVDYPLFLHFNAKQVRDSAIFGELKAAITKHGGSNMWDEIDGGLAHEFGAKLTEVESVSAFITDAPAKREPDMVVILTASKAFDKANNRLARTDDFIFKKGEAPRKWPDARGFYRSGGAGELAHYADDKTLVLLSEGLADKYLAGFAKNRTGWPFTPELSKAASANGLTLSVNLDKLPPEAKRGFSEVGDLIAAKSLTLTANLKGKELSASARATYASPTAAAAAQKQLQGLIGEAKGAMKGIDRELGRELRPIAGALKPVFAEAERVVGGANPTVSGSDLTLSATYKADFDLAALVADAVKQLKEKAPLDTALNNYKQIGLALHNYDSSYGVMPIHAIGAKGAPLKGPNDKPLLSWRVAILPYIEQDHLYRQFKLDEPWDSENNKKLIPLMPKIFAPATKPAAKVGYTHVQMLIGPGGTQPGTKLLGITDGTSNTLAVAEAADAVIWTKPDDVVVPFKYNAGELKKKFGGEFPNMFPVLFWDGSTRFMSTTVSEKTLSLLCCPNDGQVIPPDAFERPLPPPPPGEMK